jgi:CheY-specific phosphatase CheX
MKKSHSDVLAPLLSQAVQGVFDAYGAPSAESDGDFSGHDIVAVVGFSDDRVRGGLALGLSREFARSISPAVGGSDEDWVGELANQVLGRLRNQLLRYDLDIGMGTPVVLAGVGITVAPPRESALLHLRFESGEHAFGVFLETRCSDAFEFGTPTMEHIAVDEGSLMMF